MKQKLSFSIGLYALLLPAVVAAQCPVSPVARDLLNQDPTGHYTETVLERVSEGINNAKASPRGSSVIDLMDLHYLSTMESIFYMLVDTDLRAVEYSRDLTSITPCLHLDLAMMEAKMEEVRCEVNAAYDAKSPGALRQLKTIASFLNQRYKHLVKGALEPVHTDSDWVFYNEFDDPFRGWCCVLDQLECQIKESDECTEVKDGSGGYEFFDTEDACLTDGICVFAESGTTDPKYEPICPFDSNYLADNSTGYGCQLELIKQFAGSNFEAVAAEAEALEKLEDIRNEFLEDIDHIKDSTLSIDNLVDQTMLNDNERQHLQRFGEVEDVDHRRVFGCNADTAPEDRTNNDGVEGTLTPKIKPSEEWGSIAVRGPFFFRKDHLTIWKKFFRLQHEWAEQREYPDYLKKADEHEDETDRRETAEFERDTLGLIRIPRSMFRSIWKAFSHKQATQESSILPKAQDAELEVLEALKPVRPAIKRNIELVINSNTGLRKFARNYAYFLRRSCIYRPCNEKLETIIKTLYSDECFPYANGSFQVKPGAEAPDKTTWEKCQEAVDKL
ncbi:MAG: hypothetical protein HOG89_03860 [Candidatus Peribacter sp.]|jgi:hypothetical protein|nr:hypothetical protein [Candidatus Peribacter sp.]MBT4393103.1 hypothetical protein [Candidatus Peribacter sp.]MBT4600902.1 hypothetical protein [Candidatus Peribacter sp.]MBT5148968.1 hypothetical protein [Candidatus Peribacter sp.]MBT5638353.1 hypothetical protein [Candidatus Peribacter sp.]